MSQDSHQRRRTLLFRCVDLPSVFELCVVVVVSLPQQSQQYQCQERKQQQEKQSVVYPLVKLQSQRAMARFCAIS